MPEAFIKEEPRTADGWRALWRFTVDPFVRRRRPTREVCVGNVGIGATNPIRIQSMTIADTMDTTAVVDEIEALAGAGSEIVRVTAPNRTAASNLREIRRALSRRGVRVPLVADVHFTPQAALIAAEHVEKVRINPGNYADRKHFKKWEYTDQEYAHELERLADAFEPLVRRCRELGVAMRIGTNHGSLSDRILNRYGDTPAGMVESALEFVRICEAHGYRDIVLSMKASNVKVMIEAYRLLARRLHELGMDYPLHLGVTEAGSGLAARVKSTIGIATLLDDGLGDTIRVSLTEDSIHELPVARRLAAAATAAPSEAAPHASETFAPGVVPRWDPCSFARRRVDGLGSGRARLASDQPPRIETLIGVSSAGLESAVADFEARTGTLQEIDLVLVGLPPDAGAHEVEELARVAQARASAGNADWGPELELALLADADFHVALARHRWGRVAVRLELSKLGALLEPGSVLAQRLHELGAPLQYTLRVTDIPEPSHVEQLGNAFASGLLPVGALALDIEGRFDAVHAWRVLLASWPRGAPGAAIVLRGPWRADDSAKVDTFVSEAMLDVVSGVGGMLVDGVGEAVQLPFVAGPQVVAVAREILQATRMRLSQADFIACPSCGRTQFDLQSTTARVQEHLRHLKGLKIAVMGCIVNGPGEMADADFGYVGSGPGRIDLYVGHERVERNVPQAEAVSRLIELIRRNGRWSEPEA